MTNAEVLLGLFVIWCVAGFMYVWWLIFNCKNEQNWHRAVMWSVFPASTLLLFVVAVLIVLFGTLGEWLRRSV